MEKAWWGYVLLFCCDELFWYLDYDLGTTDSYFCEYADEDYRQIACEDNFGCYETMYVPYYETRACQGSPCA